MTNKIAVILVRGSIGADVRIKETLRKLNLNKRNVCIIVDATKSFIGMVSKVKDYVTYGEINEETLKLLKQKKGDSKHYNLNSPRKGYGRKGIKDAFLVGGALGYRGEKINDLIKRML